MPRQARFNADASHQLKNAAGGAENPGIGWALTRNDPALWQESLRAMNVTLDNTIVLTERLLQLSAVKRKEQGERQFAPVDLVQVVQNCCFSPGHGSARSKGIDLGYDGVQQPVMIEG